MPTATPEKTIIDPRLIARMVAHYGTIEAAREAYRAARIAADRHNHRCGVNLSHRIGWGQLITVWPDGHVGPVNWVSGWQACNILPGQKIALPLDDASREAYENERKIRNFE